MIRILSRLLMVLLVVTASACGQAAQRSGRAAYDRTFLPRAELATRPTENMHNLVRALRPNWLVTPMGGAGVASPGSAPVTVFLDRKEFGGAEMLKSISAEAVEEARYFSTTEAQSRFGLRVASPVIAITSRKPGS